MLKRLCLFLLLYYLLQLFYLFVYNKGLSQSYIKVFDVGQGDSILVKAKTGKRLLIDAGSDYEIDSKLFNEMPFKECHINIALITHPHKDHYGGFERLIYRCKFDFIFVNKSNFHPLSYNKLLSFLKTLPNTNVLELKVSNSFYLDDIKFLALWPTSSYLKEAKSNPNLVSIVLLMTKGTFNALFTGDAEKDVTSLVETRYLNSISGKYRLDFLKIPHHGGFDSLNTELFEKLMPKTSVISVGVNNVYKHPDPRVLKFFDEIGSRVYRTDLLGDITIPF